MKKLMIAAAIVCAAAFAHAGAYTWGFDGGVLAPTAAYDTDEDGYIDAGLAYATLYVMTEAGYQQVGVPATDLGDYFYGNVDKSDLANNALVNQLTSKSDTKNLQDYKLIIETTDGAYAFSYEDTATAGSVVALEETFFQNMVYSEEVTLQAVPEPTSGLLLLLGVAGLALRRRRA